MTQRSAIVRAGAAAAIAALALAISACGSSDPDPDAAVPTQTGASPTPSVTETAAAPEAGEATETGEDSEAGPQEGEWVISADQRTPAEGTTGNVTVSGTTVTVGNPNAEKRMQIYMDFFCPHCVTLHEAMSNDLMLWQAGDQVAVEYTLVDYLSPRTTHIYSARAANLLAYVADTDPESYPAVMDALLANKPETTTEVVSDEQLLELATTAGADLGADAAEALAGLQYYMWVDTGTRAAAEAGITGIPQVWVDGARVAGGSHDETAALVREAMNR